MSKFVTDQITNVGYDSETGEIKKSNEFKSTRLKTKRTADEDMEYMRVYKYFNTLLAFKDIPQTLSDIIIEFGRHMGAPEDGQPITLNAYLKDKICSETNIKIDRLNKAIGECVKYDILRPIINKKTGKPHRGMYSVNPFFISHGKTEKVEELRAQFDFVANEITAGVITRNPVTGEQVMLAIEQKKGKKPKVIPGQLVFGDFNTGGNPNE